MLPQEAMLERLRAVCHADRRLVAAMLYGSFAYGEYDAYSDLDVILYFDDAAQPAIDQRAWVAQLGPVDLYYVNAFGNGTAIYANMVRAEFHFDAARDMQQIASWQGTIWFPSLERTILLDRTGALADHLAAIIGRPPNRDTQQQAQFLSDDHMNWTLFGTSVLLRGETARALEILHIVQDGVLRMARLLEGSTTHWLTATRMLERDLAPETYARYRRCTAPLDATALWSAYRSAWEWGNQQIDALHARHGVVRSPALIDRLDRRFAEQTTQE